MTSYRQGWRVVRRSRMREPNNGGNTNSRHSRRSCFVISAVGGMTNYRQGRRVVRRSRMREPNNGAKRKKSPGAIFRERSEPVGRVSGMIRANPVKTRVRRSRTQHAAKPRYSFHSAIIFPTYSILPIYRACRDARRRVETGCFPLRCGGCGGPMDMRPHIARARATDSSHTSHRLLGGVSRRRCPSHTIIPPATKPSEK